MTIDTSSDDHLATRRAITEDVIHLTSIPDSFFSDDVTPTPAVATAAKLRAKAYLSLAKLIALEAALFEPDKKSEAEDCVKESQVLIQQLRKKGLLWGEDHLTFLTLLGEVELLLNLAARLEPDWLLSCLG